MDSQTTVWSVKPADVLILAILVQYFGMYLTRKIHFLREFYIPPAVTGGSYLQLHRRRNLQLRRYRNPF